MSDTTFCISMVVNKELDPDAYEILTRIQSSKWRSEFARILKCWIGKGNQIAANCHGKIQ